MRLSALKLLTISEAFVKAASLQSQANIVTRGFALRIDTTELPVPHPISRIQLAPCRSSGNSFTKYRRSLKNNFLEWRVWKACHALDSELKALELLHCELELEPAVALAPVDISFGTDIKRELLGLWGTPIPFPSSKLLLPNSRVSSSAIWTCWVRKFSDLWDPMTEKQKLVSGSYQETETQVNSPPPVAKLPTQNPGCSMPLPRMVLLLQKIPFSNFPKFYSSSSSVSAPTNNNKHQNELHFYGLGFRVSHSRLTYFVRSFKLSFQVPKLPKSFKLRIMHLKNEAFLK